MKNSVIQWLEETVKKFPQKTAFVDEYTIHTWEQVRQRALSIAYHINAAIPGRKHPIAIYMEKSVDMLVVYLGVAYSGNFYSPIATDMPFLRIEKILDVLQPALFISTKGLSNDIAGG